jgi:hypothetical protein
MAGHETARNQFQDHDAETAKERQSVRDQTGSEAEHSGESPDDCHSGFGVFPSLPGGVIDN